jgi:hypothetical protein
MFKWLTNFVDDARIAYASLWRQHLLLTLVACDDTQQEEKLEDAIEQRNGCTAGEDR